MDQSRRPVYHLDHENLYNDLLMIKSKYFNNHLNEEELKNYVWDNKVNSKQNFIDSYLL